MVSEAQSAGGGAPVEGGPEAAPTAAAPTPAAPESAAPTTASAAGGAGTDTEPTSPSSTDSIHSTAGSGEAATPSGDINAAEGDSPPEEELSEAAQLRQKFISEQLVFLGVVEDQTKLVEFAPEELEKIYDQAVRESLVQDLEDKGLLDKDDENYLGAVESLLALSRDELRIFSVITDLEDSEDAAQLKELLSQENTNPVQVLTELARLHAERHGESSDELDLEKMDAFWGQVQEIAAFLVGEQGEKLMEFLSDSIQGSSFGRLIDAIVKGAGYGSLNSAWANRFEADGQNIVPLKVFETAIKNNLSGFVAGFEQALNEDGGFGAEWDSKSDVKKLLELAKKDRSQAPAAMRAILVGGQLGEVEITEGLTQFMFKNSQDINAERWKKVSSALAKHIFKQDALGPDIRQTMSGWVDDPAQASLLFQ